MPTKHPGSVSTAFARQPATTTARAYIKLLADMVKAANGEARIHPEGDAAFVLLPDRLPFWAWAETPTSEDKVTTQTQIRAQLGLER